MHHHYLTRGYHDFSFSEYPYYVKKYPSKTSTVPVHITGDNRKAIVTVDDNEVPKDYMVKDSFHIAATYIYHRLLHGGKGPLPEEITWLYCRLWDEDGDETITEVRMHFKKGLFRPLVFHSPLFGVPKKVTNYKVRNVEVSEKGLLLKFDESSPRDDNFIRWKQLPVLRLASLDDRKKFTLHKHNTIIYWDKLGERLSVRDAINNGAHSMKKPDDVSDEDFIYRPKSYQNQWWYIRREDEATLGNN